MLAVQTGRSEVLHTMCGLSWASHEAPNIGAMAGAMERGLGLLYIPRRG